jgi:hypothetical protein
LPPPRTWFRPGCSHRHRRRRGGTVEFFTAQINNDHTRKAYLNATRRFATWCDDHGLDELAAMSRVRSNGVNSTL